MITIALCVLLAIIAVALFLAGKKTVDGGRTTINFRLFSLIPLGLLLIVLAFGSMYVQDEGEAIVIRSFSGKVVASDVTPGIGFTIPWNDTISFDIRNQRIEMFNDKGSGQGEDGAAITAPLEGSSNADVSLTGRYSIKPSCVEDVYKLHKDQASLEANVILPAFRDKVRQETSEFPPLSVKEQRAELTAAIFEGLSKQLENDCVVLDNLDLGAIDLDDATEAAIVKRNESEIAVDAARAKLNETIIEAESSRVRDKASSDGDQIIRCGAKTVETTRIVAGEEIVATETLPKDAAECENRVNDQVIEMRRIEMMEKAGANGNMIIVVPEDSNQILQIPATQK